MVLRACRSPRGVGFIDVLFVLGLVAVLSAFGVPMLTSAAERLRVNQAARDVERELQAAKQRAVASNRPVRVRFDCPALGQFRAVELLGTPSVPSELDGPAARCDEGRYPYPAADTDPATRPNLDGPLRRLPDGLRFDNAPAIEFWPDGTAHARTGGANPWPAIAATGVAVILVHADRTASIQVNGLGRITLQVE